MGNKRITPVQLKKLKEKISYETVVLFVACCMDEFDWGFDEIKSFTERWDRYYKAVDSHTLSIKKVAKIVEKITGMTFDDTITGD